MSSDDCQVYNRDPPGRKAWYTTVVVDLFIILIHLTLPIGFSRQGNLYDIQPVYNQKNGVQMAAVIKGVDLSQSQPQEVRGQIALDISKHMILIFKNQGHISAQRQKEISLWFGNGLDDTHRQHQKAEDKAVFRVSNDDKEGYTQVGNKAWHIDGFFTERPHTVVLYYMAQVAKKGDTVFIPLYDIVRSLPKETKALWDRVWFRSRVRTHIIHPFIYNHPKTGTETLCFNLNFIEDMFLDYRTKGERKVSQQEKDYFVQSIMQEFTKDKGYWIYNHKWEPGDFLITDNLAVGHIAHPDSQLPRNKIGLRLLHRTSVLGDSPPTKLFPLNFIPGNRTV